MRSALLSWRCLTYVAAESHPRPACIRMADMLILGNSRRRCASQQQQCYMHAAAPQQHLHYEMNIKCCIQQHYKPCYTCPSASCCSTLCRTSFPLRAGACVACFVIQNPRCCSSQDTFEVMQSGAESAACPGAALSKAMQELTLCCPGKQGPCTAETL